MHLKITLQLAADVASLSTIQQTITHTYIYRPVDYDTKIHSMQVIILMPCCVQLIFRTISWHLVHWPPSVAMSVLRY